MRGVLQPGNVVRASWRARLSEQLGQFTIELDQPIPALLLDDPLRLAGVAAACAVLDGSLPSASRNRPCSRRPVPFSI